MKSLIIVSYRDSGHIIMTFTNIKLDLSHYSASVSSSGHGCFIR